MAWIKKTFKIWPLILALIIGLAFAGCEGSDSREKVDSAVRDLSGQKSVEQMDQMKKQIQDINKQQMDRLKEPE